MDSKHQGYISILLTSTRSTHAAETTTHSTELYNIWRKHAPIPFSTVVHSLVETRSIQPMRLQYFTSRDFHGITCRVKYGRNSIGGKNWWNAINIELYFAEICAEMASFHREFLVPFLVLHLVAGSVKLTRSNLCRMWLIFEVLFNICMLLMFLRFRHYEPYLYLACYILDIIIR